MFLENITNLEYISNHASIELFNLIFGDIYHPKVMSDSQKFIKTPINKDITKIIMEISSRKVMYYNNIPLNHYYSYSKQTKYGLVEKILTNEEIEYDLQRIMKLCKTIFNEKIEIHIIPHLNLKTKSICDYIPERNALVSLLEYLCNKLDLQIHNIGKYIENENENAYLEDYMADSTHYSKDYDRVQRFLINNIIER